MIMKVSMQIIFQPIIYFLLSFRIFTVIEEHLEKRTGFDTVEEIVILKLVDGVMNAPENNKDIDVGSVANAYQVYMLQIISTRKEQNIT